MIELPDHGSDWFEGLEDCYIVISLKHSDARLTMYWLQTEYGYTDSLLRAGKFSKSRILSAPFRYNNGWSTLAVPCTRGAFALLGLWPVAANFREMDHFLNIKTAEK